MDLADGSVGRLLRVRRAHHIAILCDRAFAFEHLRDHGTRGHELHQFAEERALAVHAIEGLGLLAGNAHALLPDDPQAGTLDDRVDRAGEISLGRVGLEDREGSLHRHRSFLIVLDEMKVRPAYTGTTMAPQG